MLRLPMIGKGLGPGGNLYCPSFFEDLKRRKRKNSVAEARIKVTEALSVTRVVSTDMFSFYGADRLHKSLATFHI